MTLPKIKLWDIEATNLNADFGVILSVSVKDLGQSKIRNYNIGQYKSFDKDRTNDKALLEEAYKDLADADMWVTWFGTYYDIPMFNTRLIEHKLDPLPKVAHVDGWMIARKKMKLHSNRLASVQNFLDLEEEKTPLKGPIWIRAAAGYKDAIKYVVEHNNQDCVVLEQVYDRIKGLCDFHPNVNIMVDGNTANCPICGSKNMQMRGKTITKTGYRQRYQCTSCGGWSSSGHKKKSDIST